MYRTTSRIFILLLLQIALPCSLGHGGIRRRAWGKVHMLRSGKRGDLSPLEGADSPLPILEREYSPLPILEYSPRTRLGELTRGNYENRGADIVNILESFYPYTLDLEVLPVMDEKDKFFQRGSSLPLEEPWPHQGEVQVLGHQIKQRAVLGHQIKQRAAKSRGQWGNMHMMRSGRSSPVKRGGLWDYGRPRWGGGHMLRSGRSDPGLKGAQGASMEELEEMRGAMEVEEMANNENFEARTVE